MSFFCIELIAIFDKCDSCNLINAQILAVGFLITMHLGRCQNKYLLYLNKHYVNRNFAQLVNVRIFTSVICARLANVDFGKAN